MSSRCASCHGVSLMSGGAAPDLRKANIPHSTETLTQVLRGGALLANGMPVFPELSDDDILALRHFIARESSKAAKAKPGQDVRPNLTIQQ